MDNENNNKEQLIIKRLKKLAKGRKRPYYSSIYCVHVFRLSCTLCGKKVNDRDELFMDLCSKDDGCWDLIYELLELKCGEYLSRLVITKYKMMRIVEWITFKDPYEEEFPIGIWCCSAGRI